MNLFVIPARGRTDLKKKQRPRGSDRDSVRNRTDLFVGLFENQRPRVLHSFCDNRRERPNGFFFGSDKKTWKLFFLKTEWQRFFFFVYHGYCVLCMYVMCGRRPIRANSLCGGSHDL